MSGLDLGCIHLVRTQRGGGWYTKIIVFLFKIPTREKVEGEILIFLRTIDSPSEYPSLDVLGGEEIRIFCQNIDDIAYTAGVP